MEVKPGCRDLEKVSLSPEQRCPFKRGNKYKDYVNIFCIPWIEVSQRRSSTVSIKSNNRSPALARLERERTGRESRQPVNRPLVERQVERGGPFPRYFSSNREPVHRLRKKLQRGASPFPSSPLRALASFARPHDYLHDWGAASRINWPPAVLPYIANKSNNISFICMTLIMQLQYCKNFNIKKKNNKSQQ